MARDSQKPAARTRSSGTARTRSTPRSWPSRRVLVMVATRKGAWLYHSDAARKTWRTDGPHFLGQLIEQGTNWQFLNDLKKELKV